MLDKLAELALSADPQTQAALAELDGKRLRIVSTQPEVDLTLAFASNGVKVLPEPTDGSPPKRVHGLVRGSGLDMLKMLAGKGDNQLELSGDPQLLQNFVAIAKGYRLTPAVTAPNFLNQALGIASEGLGLLNAAIGATSRQAQSDLSQRFTNQDDQAVFFDDLLELGLQVDRLQARVERLDP